ncbi:hypothetical protein HK102_003570 [Quaeritorhiza haematococci]|nr:hypothetical protein HK102_003570 [Quaeritorhiza haematococci]
MGSQLFAKKYLARKLVVFPVGLTYDKERLVKENKVKKHLAMEKAWTAFTLQSVKSFSFTKNSIGLLTGPESGIMALDIDNMDLWNTVLTTLNQSEPETCRCISQSGGRHLIFKITPELKGVRKKGVFGFKPLGWDDFDVLGEGDFLLVPPSSLMTPDGLREYKFLDGYSLLDNFDRLLEAPEWLIDVLTPGSTNYMRVCESYVEQAFGVGMGAPKDGKRKGVDGSSRVKRARSVSCTSNSSSNSCKTEPQSDGLTPQEEALMALSVQERLEEVKKHVKKLSATCAIGRQSWIEVWMGIHHATDGSPEGMEIWDHFSRRAGPYNRRTLEQQWDSFKNGSGLTIGSLIYWGKEDTKTAWAEKDQKRAEEEKIKADEVLRREAGKFAVEHTGGQGLAIFQNWDPENFVGVIKNTMHHPDHEVKCVFAPSGAFQECMACLWCNPIVGHLMMSRSEYLLLHQQFLSITVNYNNYSNNYNMPTSDPVINIPKLEVFDDPDLNKMIWEAIHYSFTDDDGACIVHHLYKDRWVFSKQAWYFFQDHRWQTRAGEKGKAEAFPSTDAITVEVVGLLETVKNAYIDEGVDNSIIKKISAGIRGLKEVSGINSVITLCCIKFLKANFAKALDTNGDLLVFTNGVYDLVKDEFRPGQPEDNMSLTVGYPYEALSQDSEPVRVVHAWLDQVFPVAEEKHFVLKLLASCLSAVIREDKFWIWIGGGANGKSTLINLMHSVLGEYATDVSSTLFTSRTPASNAATPQLVELVNKRFVASQEIQHNERLNLEVCKRLTGGDRMPARGLYKNTEHFTNKAKIMFCLNNLPSIQSQDEGTWRRIVLLKFRSSFVDNPRKPNQFKIDRTLRNKMPSWKPAMMVILLRYYQVYQVEGLDKVPAFFTEHTAAYQSENDELGDFIEEHCELGEGFQVLQADFVLSYQRVHPRADKGAIRRSMSEKFGRGIARNDKIEVGKRIDADGVEKPKYDRGWKGLRLRSG